MHTFQATQDLAHGSTVPTLRSMVGLRNLDEGGERMTVKAHEFVRFDSGSDYRHTCAECTKPWAHPVHGREEGQDRAPERFGDEIMSSADSVLECYAAVIDVIDEYNTMVDLTDRVMIPLALQRVLADYIAEREAIESLTGGKA